MKKMKLAVLALVGVLAAGNAMAAGTATVDVNANVLGTCRFAAGNPQMDFGDIDPTSGATYNAAANLTFTCTNGTSWTLDNVANTYEFSEGGLFYTVANHTLTGSGTGGVQTVALSGSISPAQYAAATAGAYTDTITVNIIP